jgi:DNA-binding transcriptional ArsR family regulator
MTTPPAPDAASASAAVARVLHALADPTRRALVERLSERPYSVSQLAEPLAITLTAVGQHLQVLEEAGLVKTEKLGRVRSCQLEPQGLAVLQRWVEQRKAPLERKLDRLGELLNG